MKITLNVAGGSIEMHHINGVAVSSVGSLVFTNSDAGFLPKDSDARDSVLTADDRQQSPLVKFNTP